MRLSSGPEESCCECFVLIFIHDVKDKLINPASVSHLHKISNTLGAVVVGLEGTACVAGDDYVADTKSIVNKARQEAGFPPVKAKI